MFGDDELLNQKTKKISIIIKDFKHTHIHPVVINMQRNSPNSSVNFCPIWLARQELRPKGSSTQRNYHIPNPLGINSGTFQGLAVTLDTEKGSHAGMKTALSEKDVSKGTFIAHRNGS